MDHPSKAAPLSDDGRCTTCWNLRKFCRCLNALDFSVEVDENGVAGELMTAVVDDRTGMVHNPETCGGAIIEQHSRWCVECGSWHAAGYCAECVAWVDGEDIGEWTPEQESS